jgi:hypothetical protein
MPKELLDPRKILTGKEGELYDEEGNFLAQVNTFQAQVNVTNTDYQPAGSALTVAVLTSYTVTLTFTETVINDADLLKAFVEKIRAGQQLEAAFQGKINGHDDTAGRQVFRACVPDGSIDLMNIQPGDILNRAWAWRCNEPPELQSLLGA